MSCHSSNSFFTNFQLVILYYSLVPEGEFAIRPQSFAVSSSAINITWYLPAFPRGIIIKSSVYIYTNETSYATPVLALSVNGTSGAVVSGLQPYTVYMFTVTSCNSIGCTKHSTQTETRTLPSGMCFDSKINTHSFFSLVTFVLKVALFYSCLNSCTFHAG